MGTAIEAETTEVKRQVLVEGNMGLCAKEYKGKYSFATWYESQGWIGLARCMAGDRDHLYVFSIPAIEAAVAEGKTSKVGGGSVAVVDARGADGPYVARVPIAKSPHGVNIDPTGRYALCCGKPSSTVIIADIERRDDVFAGQGRATAEGAISHGPTRILDFAELQTWWRNRRS